MQKCRQTRPDAVHITALSFRKSDSTELMHRGSKWLVHLKICIIRLLKDYSYLGLGVILLTDSVYYKIYVYTVLFSPWGEKWPYLRFSSQFLNNY